MKALSSASDELKRGEAPVRKSRPPAGDVALYVLTGLHFLTLVQFCAHFGWVIGYNVLFFVPAILLSALRRSKWLLIVNLVLFVIGVIFVLLHYGEAISV
ncbi:MAG: hypothetical protein II128_05535 [Atopobiaceae bacterium]|nr:hypothetical protein [Atopobiaceae bacterium]